jgi:hypothetical protein
MPEIAPSANVDEVFREARGVLSNPDSFIEQGEKGQRAIAVVSPARLVMYLPCPRPGSVQEDDVAPMKSLLPPEPPLNISVVSYTAYDAFIKDKTKSIPFIGLLAAWGYIGHNVVIFEGHPSAFESGVRGSDVLLVDSGMLPFMQNDWAKVAYRVMRPDAKIFVHERDTFTLLPVAKSKNVKGWQYSEYDGEASYANCLLVILAKGNRPSVVVTSGQALPALADMTTDADDLDWISGLPFKYDRLNADKVIEVFLKASGWSPNKSSQTKGVLKALLVSEDKKPKSFSFSLTLTKDAKGRSRLQIQR